MRIALTAVVLTAAFATAAEARGSLSDVEYLQAARCSGLAASGAFGEMDTASLDAMLKAEGRGRAAYISDKADSNRADAKRVAARAKNGRKADLQAELSGACARYLG